MRLHVCVDPGCGMSARRWGLDDPGAIHEDDGIAFRESDVTLRYGRTLRDALAARGAPVFLTRDDAGDHAPAARRASDAVARGCGMLLALRVAAPGEGDGVRVLHAADPDPELVARLDRAVAQVAGERARAPALRADAVDAAFDGPVAAIALGSLGSPRDRAALLDPLLRERLCDAIAEAVLG
jgi:N-acetylmuramoyl-L-alanine amidase